MSAGPFTRPRFMGFDEESAACGPVSTRDGVGLGERAERLEGRGVGGAGHDDDRVLRRRDHVGGALERLDVGNGRHGAEGAPARRGPGLIEGLPSTSRGSVR